MAMTLAQQRAEAEADAERRAQDLGGFQPPLAPAVGATRPVAFDGSNVPGYDPETGIVSGGTIDDKTGNEYGIGLRQLLESTAGMAGDIGQTAGQIGGWAAGQMGASPETQSTVGNVASYATPFPFAPTSEQIRQGVTDPLLGKPDDPLTLKGDIARTSANFAGGAFMPGGPLRQAAGMALPAIGSELGAYATKDTGYEDYGRAAGSLAGGLAAAGRVNPAATASKGAMTREALKGKVDDIYNALRQQGIKYDSNAWNQTIGEMGQELYKQGIRPAQAEPVFKYVDDLMKNGANSSLDFDDINSLHMGVAKSARDAAAHGDTQLEGAWNVVLDKLDDFETQAPLMTTSGTSQEVLNSARSTARRAALQNIKQRTLDRIASNAETYQGGMEAGIRTGIGNLLRSNKGTKLFTGPERTALLEVEQGRKTLNTLSRFGLDITNLAGRASFIPAVGAGTIYAGGEPLLAASLLAAGTAAKIASPKLTMRALEQAGGAVRSGKLTGAGGVELTKKLKDEQTRRRLLSAQMGVNAANNR